jgi:glycosyltransferase involved in cell wall biosynthesis
MDFPASEPGGVWVVHVNAPEAIAAMSRIIPSHWLGRYRIGYWAYELAEVPSSWVRIAEAFHEIWAPSRFVAEALSASGIKIPVRVMPHPVALLPPPCIADTMQSDFVVLAMGDLKSSAARKNLVGAIDIYRGAFPDVAPGRRLVLKVQSDDADPEFREAALKAINGRGDILLRTGSMTDEEISRLVAGASVVLSPHRSEGFGLVLAEAFLAGVPALATGWSGNVDFMGDIPELMIGHELVPVLDASRIYRAPGLKWAEPDKDDAVGKLLALERSSSLRRELAARGRAAVEAQLIAWSRQALYAGAIGMYVASSIENDRL